MNDFEITELYFARDERAIRETDEKYGALIFSVAYGILGDAPDSEECRNDALLSLWNAIPPERPRSLRAYALQIVRRIALDRYKQKRRKKRIPSELTVSMEELHAALESGSETADNSDAEHLRELINSFVRALPERRRYIFVERYYAASKPEKIAKDLGLSQRTVYTEIDRIKESLRSYLSENEVYL